MISESEEQRAVPQTFCKALFKEPNCKCLVLSVLIYGCLAAVTWCRCANVTKVVINFSKYPIKTTKHVSPCDDGYIYIPVAFMGMLYLVYLVECYHSPVRIDFLHAEGQDAVLSKLSQLRFARPAIWWKAISYHYVRRKRQVTRYRNGDNYTTTQVYYERVNTHAATSFYYYDYCGVKDISKDLMLEPEVPIAKITVTTGFAFSNVRSATEFEEARSRFFAEQELRDDYMEMREGLDLGCGMNPTSLVAVLGNPWFTNRYVYWCLSALLLSWPLRVIIEYKTQYAEYQVTKLFGTNYDTPTCGEPIRASASQLSQPGNYMLAPSYSEALLMEPSRSAVETNSCPSEQPPAVDANVCAGSDLCMEIVPSYSEALLYERAEQAFILDQPELSEALQNATSGPSNEQWTGHTSQSAPDQFPCTENSQDTPSSASSHFRPLTSSKSHFWNLRSSSRRSNSCFIRRDLGRKNTCGNYMPLVQVSDINDPSEGTVHDSISRCHTSAPNLCSSADPSFSFTDKSTNPSDKNLGSVVEQENSSEKVTSDGGLALVAGLSNGATNSKKCTTVKYQEGSWRNQCKTYLCPYSMPSHQEQKRRRFTLLPQKKQCSFIRRSRSAIVGSWTNDRCQNDCEMGSDSCSRSFEEALDGKCIRLMRNPGFCFCRLEKDVCPTDPSINDVKSLLFARPLRRICQCDPFGGSPVVPITGPEEAATTERRSMIVGLEDHTRDVSTNSSTQERSCLRHLRFSVSSAFGDRRLSYPEATTLVLARQPDGSQSRNTLEEVDSVNMHRSCRNSIDRLLPRKFDLDDGKVGTIVSVACDQPSIVNNGKCDNRTSDSSTDNLLVKEGISFVRKKTFPGLTRSLTERQRRSAVGHRETDRRRSFIGRLNSEYIRPENDRRTCLNIETSL